MGYIESKVLQSDEKIVKRVHINKIKLIFVWIWGIIGSFLLFIPTIRAIKKTIIFCTTELVVTNKNVIEKYGWINTHSDSMMISKIENVTVNQRFWGKVFNYGNVCIQGTNRNDINFNFVKNPEEVRKFINETRSQN